MKLTGVKRNFFIKLCQFEFRRKHLHKLSDEILKRIQANDEILFCTEIYTGNFMLPMC